MHALSDTTFPDETPTAKTENVSTRVLVFASRIDRMAEQAIAALDGIPDSDSVAIALEELAKIRALTAGAMR